MMPLQTQTTRPINRTAAVTLLMSVTLAACGGGGSADSAAEAATVVDGTRVTLAAPPTLPVGGSPVATARYVCGNLALGAATAGEIEVPAGQVCVLQGTRVNGNLTLNAGSVLDARDIQVTGNVQALGASSVLLAGASGVGGSVQLTQGGSATLVGTRITGDLQLGGSERGRARPGHDGGRQPAGDGQPRWGGAQWQPCGRQPAVQGQPAGPPGQRQHRGLGPGPVPQSAARQPGHVDGPGESTDGTFAPGGVPPAARLQRRARQQRQLPRAKPRRTDLRQCQRASGRPL